MSFKSIVTALALGIFAVVLYDFLRAYFGSKATGFARWLEAGRGSATMVAAQLGALTFALVTASDQIVDWGCALLNAPGAEDQIRALISQYVTTTTVGVVMLLFTGLVTLARLRSLGKAAA